MKCHIQLFQVILFLCCLNAHFSYATDDDAPLPDLLLANSYQTGIKLDDYWVSEKLDGVRAFWNGTNFVSRQGNVFHVPVWFSRVLPDIKLDGELWLGRGKFDQLSGIVRQRRPDDLAWREVKYMVFDLPGQADIFDQRLEMLKNVVSAMNAPHVQWVAQFKVSSHEALAKELDDRAKQGAEGLMLHLGSSVYKSGCSDDLLKFKKYLDAEAVVIAHVSGKGKYKDMMGSLEVVTADNRRFNIGTGFSDEERKNPPAIGATITYKYFGLTNNGIPRFASFMRVRNSF